MSICTTPEPQQLVIARSTQKAERRAPAAHATSQRQHLEQKALTNSAVTHPDLQTAEQATAGATWSHALAA